METWELHDEQPWGLKGNTWKKTTKTNYEYNDHFKTGLSGEQTIKRGRGKRGHPEKKMRNKLDYDTQLFIVSTLHPLLCFKLTLGQERAAMSLHWEPLVKRLSGHHKLSQRLRHEILPIFQGREKSLSPWLSRLRHSVCAYVSFFNQHIIHEVRFSNRWTSNDQTSYSRDIKFFREIMLLHYHWLSDWAFLIKQESK